MISIKDDLHQSFRPVINFSDQFLVTNRSNILMVSIKDDLHQSFRPVTNLARLCPTKNYSYTTEWLTPRAWVMFFLIISLLRPVFHQSNWSSTKFSFQTVSVRMPNFRRPNDSHLRSDQLAPEHCCEDQALSLSAFAETDTFPSLTLWAKETRHRSWNFYCSKICYGWRPRRSRSTAASSPHRPGLKWRPRFGRGSWVIKPAKLYDVHWWDWQT